MNDRKFLIWIHEILEHVHNERPLFDYMHILRSIILNTPKDKKSGHISTNSINDVFDIISKEGETDVLS